MNMFNKLEIIYQCKKSKKNSQSLISLRKFNPKNFSYVFKLYVLYILLKIE